MRILGFVILWLFFYTNIYSQVITFNKRMTFGCVNAILTSLETTDSCYYVIGFSRDTISCRNSSLFVKFDTLGNSVLHKILPNDNGTYETWAPTLKTDTDGNLIVTAYFFDTVNNMKGCILRYNHSGDLIENLCYNSPYSFDDFIRPDDIEILPDSGYLMVNSIYDDLSILRLDKYGDIIWHQTRGGVGFMEGGCSAYVGSDGEMILSYMKHNLNWVSMNYTIRCIIEKLDSTGNMIWQYQSPLTEQIYGANDLIKSKDGGWIIASAWGSELVGSSGNVAVSQGYVFKLDSARNFEWGKILYSDAAYEGVTKKVIELEDSSIVTFGNVVRSYPPPPATASYGIIHGHIVKLSPHGDSIWSRDYEYMTTPGARNYIYDAERTYDGGFLICGESRGTGAGAFQQGWLLKLDEHGCLVPGCHLPLNTAPTAAVEKMRMLLYPNPTTDYLNVFYQTEKLGSELTFSVIDMQGRVLQHYTTADLSDKTYIVPVYELVTGIYVLEVRRDGAIIQSEKFIKN